MLFLSKNVILWYWSPLIVLDCGLNNCFAYKMYVFGDVVVINVVLFKNIKRFWENLDMFIIKFCFGVGIMLAHETMQSYNVKSIIRQMFSKILF